MSNSYTLNLKALLFTAIATVPTLLVINGLDDSIALAVTQATAQNRTEAAPPAQFMRLAQLSGVTDKTVLVD